MSPDTFVHQMKRWGEELAHHPQVLKEWAIQEEFVTTVEQVARDLQELAELIRKQA